MSPLFFLALFFFSSPTPTTSVPIQLVSYPNGALVPLEPWRLPGAEVFEVVEEPWRRKVGDGEVVQVEEHLLLDPSSRLARLLSQVVSCSISYVPTKNRNWSHKENIIAQSCCVASCHPDFIKFSPDCLAPKSNDQINAAYI